MFWKVHWNNYLSADEVEDWTGEISDIENVTTCNNYEAAFGRFIMVTSDSDVARCFVTVHKNDSDIEGIIMLAYANSWQDKIIIKSD